ncbi:MAG TPA: response regulator [Candidatus Sulfotelmatobacter sp.]|nr:response regulator [Candidatus Sulfotelmatobacter sp.]
MDKILLVDDDDSMRGLLKMRLSDTYETIDTGDPVQALELALQHKPRAILLDLMMPDCSGFELCQSFHSLSYTARIPIFVVSGQSASKYRDYMQGLGASGYFEKPIDFAKLKSRLASELQSRQLERRAHTRVRMNLILKLKGNDIRQRSFEQLTTTENVSAGGFLCPLPVELPDALTLQVFLSGAGRDQYVGSVRVVRRECAGTPWQRYAFQFIERTSEWILQG